MYFFELPFRWFDETFGKYGMEAFSLAKWIQHVGNPWPPRCTQASSQSNVSPTPSNTECCTVLRKNVAYVWPRLQRRDVFCVRLGSEQYSIHWLVMLLILRLHGLHVRRNISTRTSARSFFLRLCLRCFGSHVAYACAVLASYVWTSP